MISEEEKLLVLLKWSAYISQKELNEEINDWMLSYELDQPNMSFIDFIDSVMSSK